MTDETADVVISGAGPNGLMLACELALAGVRPVVLDKLPGPSAEPKANGLVGQVIRQLDLRGLYHAFGGDDGPPRPVHGWMFAGLPLNFLEVEDNPMYALLLPQPRLVRLLEKRARDLGVDIRWGHELTALSAGADAVAVTVTSAERTYRVDAGYLVGADGGRSTVRKSAGIDFPGSTAPTIARIAHVHLRDELRTADGGYEVPGFGRIAPGHSRFDNGSLIFFQIERDRPMLGTVEYGWTPGSADGPMTLDEMRESLRRVVGVDVPFEPPQGPGPHALRRLDGQNSRQAETYRAGRILLLGDAAHVHSPMGGPGLEPGDAGRGQPRLETGRGGERMGTRRTARHVRVRALPGGGAGDDALSGADRADGAGTRCRRAANAFRRVDASARCRRSHGGSSGRLRCPL